MHPRFLSFALVVLLVIGLLMFGGSAMQRRAWTQGYLMGQAVANGDGNAGAVLTPYMAYGQGFGGPGFGLVACLLPLGLLALLFLAAGRSFRHKAWQGAGGPPEHWRHRWHHGPGPCRHDASAAPQPTGPANTPDLGTPAASPEAVDPNR
jgi:hypothetical protein